MARGGQAPASAWGRAHTLMHKGAGACPLRACWHEAGWWAGAEAGEQATVGAHERSHERAGAGHAACGWRPALIAPKARGFTGRCQVAEDGSGNGNSGRGGGGVEKEEGSSGDWWWHWWYGLILDGGGWHLVVVGGGWWWRLLVVHGDSASLVAVR